MSAEYLRDLRQHARTVLHLHTEEEFVLHFPEIFHRDLPVTGAADPSRTVICQIPRHIDHISCHRAGSGHLARASAVEHRVVHCVSVDEHCIERVSYRGKRMVFRQHHRIYSHFNPVSGIARNAEQFDHTVKFFRVGDIRRRDLRDAFCIDIGEHDS